ncbi:MAG: TonB-dependent receptor [Gammaproteobacteria bacterium]|nr:TonB-dependent receptor [Gammaproteobacteria bacterium]
MYGQATTATRALYRRVLAAALAAALAVPGVSTLAESEDRTGVIEEIVVTASKRESNLQDLPLSINAFGSERLEDSGVQNIEAVQYLAAGIKIGDYLGQSIVTMRGIGVQQLAAGAATGSAVHVDGVYRSSRYDTSRPYFDMERIEVLRGPQGTLYGRNATGGTINVITRAPTEEFEIGGRATVGNYNLVQTEGHLSGPIAGSVLGRFAFKTTNRDGFTKNLFNGKRWNDADQMSFRGKLEYRASDRLTLLLTADRSTDDSVQVAHLERFAPDRPTVIELTYPGAYLPTALAATRRVVNHDAPTSQTVDTEGVSVRVDLDLGIATLTSLTAWRHVDYNGKFDIDYTNANAAFFRNWPVDNETLSQEFNLVSASGGAVDWVIGAFYFVEDIYTIIDLRGGRGIDYVLGAPRIDTDAWAVFADGTYRINDSLDLTVGARYSSEDKELEEFLSIPLFRIMNTDELAERYSSFTPKIALTWHVRDNVSLYATIARGFKSGGFNSFLMQGSGFDPEEVTNYEIGMKSILADGRLSLNWSLFSMDYEDLQVFQVVMLPGVVGTSTNIVTNAGQSDIDGIELEILAEPVDGLTIDLNASYLDATYGELWLPTIYADSTVNVEGNHLVGAPKWAYNVGVARSFPVGAWGTGAVRVEYSWQDQVYFRPHNEERISMDDYGLVNLRVTFRDAAGRWTYTLFGANLTDELIVAYQNLTTGDNFPIQNAFTPPRTYGLSIGANF